MMPLLWLKRWSAPDALTALFHTTKTPWSFEPFVQLTEGQITQLKGMGNMSDILQKSQYMHMYIYMNMYAYMLLRSTTQYYVVIGLRSNSTT